jgi:hypothetical protein
MPYIGQRIGYSITLGGPAGSPPFPTQKVIVGDPVTIGSSAIAQREKDVGQIVRNLEQSSNVQQQAAHLPYSPMTVSFFSEAVTTTP